MVTEILVIMRKLKSGGRKNNTKALSVAETERIVQFIKQYAEDHAVHLPAVSQVSSETTSSSSPPPHLRAGSTDTTLRVQEGQVCSITTMSLRVVFVLKIYEKILLNTKQFQLIWLHVVLFLLG